MSLPCVGAPFGAERHQDQSAVLRLAAELGCALRGKPGAHVFVFRSNLVPGTVGDVRGPILELNSGKKGGAGLLHLLPAGVPA